MGWRFMSRMIDQPHYFTGRVSYCASCESLRVFKLIFLLVPTVEGLNLTVQNDVVCVEYHMAVFTF